MKESLEGERQNAGPLNCTIGMIMIDLDYFKPFNDSYGHEAGEFVWIELAGFRGKFIRNSKIGCRYGVKS